MAWAMPEEWIVMSLLAAAAWALSCVIDVSFVGNGLYRKASDAPAVTGVFCIVPALLASGSLDMSGVTWAVALVGGLSGVAFLLHVYFYFRALFLLNDSVNAEIFNTLGVLFVPVLAFLFLGERLAWLNYVAIALALCGILLLIGMQLSRLPWAAVGYLCASVVSASVMMVMQAWVLETTSYATAVWLFSAASFAVVVVVFGTRTSSRRRIVTLCRRFGGVFVLVELLELAAVLGSHRATDLSPSVSLVALIECSLPIFIMAFSWLLAGSVDWMRTMGIQVLRSTMSLQTNSAPSKIASMLLIVMAIALVQG